MVSLDYAASHGKAIPENVYPQILAMTPEQFALAVQRFPDGEMVLPKPEKKTPAKKAAPKKKAAKKEEE
tara:strand:- start:19 stop:225 length:207 start_codon:yes stop_codon:yes gene_type:complete